MSETVSVFPTPRPRITRVSVDRPWVWLAAGWRDFIAVPGTSLAYGLVPVIAGWLAVLLMLWLDLPYLVLPLSAGFFFVGPFMAVGLYEVSRRLDKLNLSDDTEQLQTGIVSNIDALIEKLQKLPPPSSSSSSENSDKDPSDSDSTSQGQKDGSKQSPQPAPQNQQGADSSSRSAPQPKTGKAGESTEQNLRQARERAAALARRRALIDEVWGHLPPAMRERLLNVGSETLLPRYEEMIRRYYEALAEPERTDSRR